ncbi:MAG: hypothetical protein GXO77_11665 [Calditrichaeota bacterium]|nr:hypothetical protein [Calditrichota bacterium]
MKAVFFVKGVDHSLNPLTRLIPKAMAPLLNRPMLEYYILQAKKAGIEDIKIILHNFPEQVERYFKDGKRLGVKISYSLEKELYGDFRCLRKIRSSLDAPFIFSDADFFTFLNWEKAVAEHKASQKMLSLVCAEFNPIKNHFEIQYDPESKKLLKINRIKKSRENEQTLLLTGLYLLEPDLLDFLDDKNINSIAQDLVSALLRKNVDINVIKTDGFFEPLSSLHYYWKLNLKLLEQGIFKEWIEGRPVKDDIIIGRGCRIKANFEEDAVGPILIGDRCEIGKEVTVRGPAIIGNNVKIDRGATITQSIILDNTYIGKMVELRDSIVAKNCYISLKNLFGTFVEENFIISDYLKEPLKVKANRLLIGLIDKTIALIGLILLLPLFLIIAILIKLDSRGSVFYVSERLKRPKFESKDKNHYQYIKEESVKYYVFRTMYENADNRLNESENKNVYKSGPYRKIENDPRVTRVGRFLRRTSLDELPLLINVLKGDLSLVGIWALPKQEAEILQAEGLRSDNLDMSEVARIRFQGRLGLAGFWQARGRSDLTAEDRALHDSFQSALISLSALEQERLGEYREVVSLRGYLRLLWETFIAVIKRKGAQ